MVPNPRSLSDSFGSKTLNVCVSLDMVWTFDFDGTFGHLSVVSKLLKLRLLQCRPERRWASTRWGYDLPIWKMVWKSSDSVWWFGRVRCSLQLVAAQNAAGWEAWELATICHSDQFLVQLEPPVLFRSARRRCEVATFWRAFTPGEYPGGVTLLMSSNLQLNTFAWTFVYPCCFCWASLRFSRPIYWSMKWQCSQLETLGSLPEAVPSLKIQAWHLSWGAACGLFWGYPRVLLVQWLTDNLTERLINWLWHPNMSGWISRDICPKQKKLRFSHPPEMSALETRDVMFTLSVQVIWQDCELSIWLRKRQFLANASFGSSLLETKVPDAAQVHSLDGLVLNSE